MRHAVLFLVLVLGAALAQAEDVPKRKSGLWEVKRTSVRTEGNTRPTQYCIDEASDNAFRQLAEGMRNENCKVSKQRRDGDKWVVDAVCDLGHTNTKAKTHAVISGSFETAYKIESTSTFEPPMRGKAEGSAVIEGRWTGPCKADQKPGDVILANGRKVNVAEEASKPAYVDKGEKKGSKGGGGNYMPAPSLRALPAPPPPSK